ncbi:hypothetical protein O181_040501 [Austropuccinia psidii MF-1]|uniref:FCP1 homology domain-containing protein n=1 Tax=Austropuccinia psidii MF-1 TaxID=1389203 RepID=A0A9Q3HDF9_9BASI|nr:hypothetical protein [Austropuccinia psidii MF-1]
MQRVSVNRLLILKNQAIDPVHSFYKYSLLMNSLTWLLAPRTRSGSLNHLKHLKTQRQSSFSSKSSSLSPSTLDLGSGPRESEAEMVDKMVDSIERFSGPAVANKLERKASIGLDGILRFGLPGITERRRTVHLESIPTPCQADRSEVVNQDTSHLQSSSATKLPQIHQHLARLLPVRLGINLYILIRRFLSLFGLRLSPLESPSDKRSSDQSSDQFFKRIWSRFIKKNKSVKTRQVPRTNKTLVLDLDETLIHSTSRLGGMGGSNGWTNQTSNSAGLKARVVEVVLDGRIVVYHVYKRPWVDFFLKTVSSWYTVVIFTASMREYADPVIDWLDQGRGLIDARLFRESCTNIKGSYVKDLTIVERDLSKVCLVDNSPISYGLHQANAIPIEGWLNDPSDEGLLELLPMLDSLRFTKDRKPPGLTQKSR